MLRAEQRVRDEEQALARDARAMKYDAARDFGGYGTRDGPRARAYIARGGRAVELASKNGRKVVIGSQHPAGLQGCSLTASKRTSLKPPVQLGS